jgi:hypothetical protein
LRVRFETRLYLMAADKDRWRESIYRHKIVGTLYGDNRASYSHFSRPCILPCQQESNKGLPWFSCGRVDRERLHRILDDHTLVCFDVDIREFGDELVTAVAAAESTRCRPWRQRGVSIGKRALASVLLSFCHSINRKWYWVKTHSTAHWHTAA